MENIRVVCFPCGQHCSGGDLAETSVTHWWPGFSWLVRLSPCSFVIPCAVLTWSIEEDIQSLTAPQEHNYETLACRYSHVWLFVTLWTIALWLLGPWNSPGRNTGVGCYFVLQGIFPTQRKNPRQNSRQVSCVSALAGRFFTLYHLGSPRSTIL